MEGICGSLIILSISSLEEGIEKVIKIVVFIGLLSRRLDGFNSEFKFSLGHDKALENDFEVQLLFGEHIFSMSVLGIQLCIISDEFQDTLNLFFSDTTFRRNLPDENI